ncbi:MAG: hypothetical protein QNI84_14035 [Henriciella sp.]|nr:hypothetical protein [Henriciella sp.]
MADPDFSKSPNQLAESYKAIMAGDAPTAITKLAEGTSADFSHNQVTMVISIGLLFAGAALIQRLQPILQPFADAWAERIKARQKTPKKGPE